MPGHALITGASSGIGAALARELARRGWSVGLVARRAERLDALVSELREAGHGAAAAGADVTEPDALATAISALEAELGPCALLVANAGIKGDLDPARLSVAEVRRTMEVNFFGALHAVECVLPGMLERGEGHLVVVSSIAATRGLPPAGTYSASKAAVSTMWEAMRVELAPRGVHCTTVHPGFVESELTADNRFEMPMLMSAERAARIMVDGIEARARSMTFPWPMAVGEAMLRLVPDGLFDVLVRRFAPIPKRR